LPTDDADNGKQASGVKALAAELANQLKADDADKALIAAEIAAQLKPMQEALAKVQSWMLGLWSNGSNQPEGYLQRARAEDKRHIADLLSNQQDIARRVGLVEDYVAEQKIIRAERERADEEKARLAAQEASKIQLALDTANTKVNRRISRQNILIALAALLVSIFMAWITYKEYQRHTAVNQSHSQVLEPQHATSE
jgi:hypothetical protein